MPEATINGSEYVWPEGYMLSVSNDRHGWTTACISPATEDGDDDSMVGRTLTADDPEPPEGTVAASPQGMAWTRGPSGWIVPNGAHGHSWADVAKFKPVIVLRWGWGE